MAWHGIVWHGMVVVALAGMVCYGYGIVMLTIPPHHMLGKINIFINLFVSVVTCNDHYCYYLLKSIVRWNVALAECRRFNADLLSIRDSSENEWIVDNILKTQAISSVHLGKFCKLQVIQTRITFCSLGLVIYRWVSANIGLKFNLLFWFLYFYMSVSFKTSETKTTVVLDKFVKKYF